MRFNPFKKLEDPSEDQETPQEPQEEQEDQPSPEKQEAQEMLQKLKDLKEELDQAIEVFKESGEDKDKGRVDALRTQIEELTGELKRRVEELQDPYNVELRKSLAQEHGYD
ncbi:MAG: hypothetical protein R3346_04185, partial [Candidatus Spechtbacterales bacterium]|nr:hypothetical protein [Candidatus Spechtbacterales bacterium]